MKILVIGLGSMGKRRIRNLKFLNVAEIRGYDPQPERAALAAEKYDIPTTASLDEAWDWPADAVVISTPPDKHMEYARKACDAGRHFFIEASVVDDGIGDLIERLKGKSLVAAPSCTMRFHPGIRQIKDLVDSGDIGPILNFTYHLGQYLPDWHPWEDYRTFYVSRRETGAAREMVCFELVWLTWLLGQPTLISCMKDKLTGLDTDIDDAYQILLRTEKGVLGHLMIDVISRVPYRTIRLVSEQGLIEWSWTDQIVRLWKAGTNGWQDMPEPPQSAEPGYVAAEDMYREEMAAFLAAIKGEAAWPHSLRDDLRVLELLTAAERSSDENRHVAV